MRQAFKKGLLFYFVSCATNRGVYASEGLQRCRSIARIAPLILWGGRTQPMPLSPAKGRRGFTLVCFCKPGLQRSQTENPWRKPGASVVLSGWQDSNLRPPGPKPGAMTGLRYIPNPFSLRPGLKKNSRRKTAADQCKALAVREGFEPSVQSYPYGSLANY